MSPDNVAAGNECRQKMLLPKMMSSENVAALLEFLGDGDERKWE